MKTAHNAICRCPFVSIIIPVYNDGVGIQETLVSLFKLDYPVDRFEIIVVDNNSTDNTRALILDMVSDFTGNMIVETEKRTGSYAARNRGIHVANGEILAFVDSDMIVGSDWLRKGVDHMIHNNVDYAGCRIQIYSKKNEPTLWEKYQVAMGFPVKEYMEIDGYAPTACLFVRRKVIDATGKFDDRLFSGGDVEFGKRVRERGFKQSFDSGNIMYHPARRSFQSLIKKQKRVILGQIRLCNLFPERFGHNRMKDIVFCCIHLFPMASPWVIKKISRPMVDFLPLFGIFYVLRLYTCWLKFVKRCFF